ncbi:hypothetical protein L2E82_26152 [Cichorium intybus]|uniref:Uncharacterized protein n=1 Tax=Cichorium intybus TaxID=13427 RepID=A0ACB9E5Z9_CICIN|nr:hypothetical protein L2E82_26152 [Cichorium intybus]
MDLSTDGLVDGMMVEDEDGSSEGSDEDDNDFAAADGINREAGDGFHVSVNDANEYSPAENGGEGLILEDGMEEDGTVEEVTHADEDGSDDEEVVGKNVIRTRGTLQRIKV